MKEFDLLRNNTLNNDGLPNPQINQQQDSDKNQRNIPQVVTPNTPNQTNTTKQTNKNNYPLDPRSI